MINVVVLGSTGSIGTQTLDIALQHPERINVVGLAARQNASLLLEQSQKFPSAKVALYEQNDRGIPYGMQSLIDLATDDAVDVVVVSVAGVIGLLPTFEAIKAGKHIALASKEVLVAAGEIVMPLVQKHRVDLRPIDSEHSALFQCLQGYRSDQVDELILTASGGPFRGWTAAQLKTVTRQQALNHPTWSMGGKITIDSATLMNKGLETIEARWLFDIPIERVDAVIHPQSIIHSYVKLKDGSVLAQLGWPNMRLPIQYALLYPDRVHNDLKPWSPVDSPTLTFEPIDHTVFPAIELAKSAQQAGGTMPAVMNAANEAAVAAFLEDKIAFHEIVHRVEQVMQKHDSAQASLESILEADSWARETFSRFL